MQKDLKKVWEYDENICGDVLMVREAAFEQVAVSVSSMKLRSHQGEDIPEV